MTARETFLFYLLTAATGQPYIWGGQSPDEGFDCSGMVVWGLGKAGISIPDTNAHGIYAKYRQYKVTEKAAQPGSLWFYGKDKISHVMVCVRRWRNGEHVLMGARGGTATTSTETANAFVDTVCGSTYDRAHLKAICDPFLAGL